MKESAVLQCTVILCQEVLRQFHCKLLTFPQRLQRLSEAVIVEPIKCKMSEFISFKLTSNRDFHGENFSSLVVALPYDPFRSMANN